MTSQRYPVTPTHTLPAKPSLEQLKKQAKDLLKAVKTGDVSACPVLRLHVRFVRAEIDVRACSPLPCLVIPWDNSELA